jgi:hypothetical protein
MPSLFSTSDFGPERGAHGAAASAQVSYNSDFGPRQTLTQEQYAALAKQLDGVVASMKSVGAYWRRLGGLSDSYDAGTEIGQAQQTLKKCRIQLSKAEAAAEDNEPEDTQAAIDSAQKLLGRAKQMILVAEADVETEEADAACEKAKSEYRKCKSRLASVQKAKPAPAVAAAPAGTVTPDTVAKTTAALNQHLDVLMGQLRDVVEQIGRTSRSAGSPPNFALVKAEGAANSNTGGIPSQNDIQRAYQAGKLTQSDTIQCPMQSRSQFAYSGCHGRG